MSLFNTKFGPSGETGKLQFVFVPRTNGASYSRLGFAVINAGSSDEGRFSTLAHEIVHFRWAGAKTSTWEDWLNKSFAEHSALMVFEEKYGADKFIERFAKFESMSKDSYPIFFGGGPWC